MTARAPESRRQRATAVAAQLAEIVYEEGRKYAFSYLTLMDIRDTLADPEAEAETALAEAAQRFDGLCRARNFSEFYVYIDDWEQRVAANERVKKLVNDLRSLLHDS
ncbi:hypothetical protein FGW37_12985 [Streptomyces rectiverticillatus]|uniref:hypothetical protein n=1 Tax=Streptomyces rectiverticillatus TaxID=173860 RepID=UPI0015C2ED1B|nr:hypothetical protein [Streptomyces rectiverticillatus]QLE72392.1 hypothetical protein FGW37_12985 [Streptomyces rectiverticillatus]